MKTLLVFFIGFPLFAIAQSLESRTAKYYEIGKVSEPPLFTQLISVGTSESGDRTWTSEIKDDSGSVVIQEMALIKSDKVVTQTVSNFARHETCELQVGTEEVTYRLYKFEDGKRGELLEEKTRTKEENFVTGPSVEFYIAQRWDSLNAGESISVEFGIFEVLRSIGFDLTKEGETEQVMKVKMRPSNFFVRLIVGSIHLELDKVTRRLVHYQGITPLRRLREGKMVPWDSEVIYETAAPTTATKH
jgi:hypothetical protein